MIYDCAIIGGGPAGLNAALVLGRARRSIVLFDHNRPRNAVTHASHGFITRDGVTIPEFRRIAHEELGRYPSIRLMHVEVTKVAKVDGVFHVHDTLGHCIQAKKLILATGVKEIFLEIEGFTPLYGKSLFNCVYCDGWELRDQPLVVVSEHAAGFHTVKLLYQWSKDLALCTNGHSTLTHEQKMQLQSKGVKVMEQPIAAFIGHNDKLQHLRFADGTELARSGGFVTPKFEQSAPFAAQLGCELTATGGIKTDDSGRTTIAGVYAAGDAASFSPSQVVFAAADGSRIAMQINRELTEEEFEQGEH
ncbi:MULTISPECIES: NAD(P)/FAD-dependent oxidoreductase [Paenibacillus]|uniref:NAD(P)/FAD-dependent oxidoreductase n=1 Tax=Paenibacillus alvei TaxID=44250 RepID=A0ABT4ECU8_PAEAL|nr:MULTISPECIES: NAD(P)/FAD-dependent oxidoreductase [Paenibacillus]EPY10993.1 thioredoxin reductase [Paenibacillus alvei A6-6i-x]MCY9530313.1 NAD(P)/FAD-dependent oxidoreductase [Paenibacillus alvei]